MKFYETIELEPTPTNEPCSQTGDEDYNRLSIAECNRFKDLLRTCFPEAASREVEFITDKGEHDFGSYRFVSIRFNSQRDESIEYAYWVEGEVPDTWDDTRVRIFGESKPTPLRDAIRAAVIATGGIE